MRIIKEKNFDVEELITNLCTADRNKNTVFSTDRDFNEIQTSRDRQYTQLSRQIGRYCRIYDYTLLEAFVESTDCEEAIKVLTDFTDEMHGSILTELNLLSESGQKLNPDDSMPGTYKFVIKYVGDHCTMPIQAAIQNIILEHFRLQKGTIVFKGAGEGCITFMYQISKAAKMYLQQYRLEDKDIAAFAAFNVTCLIIDGTKRMIPSLWSMKVCYSLCCVCIKYSSNVTCEYNFPYQ